MDQAFVGHLGTAELAGASLAGVWIDVVSGWLWPSFGSAVNILSAQAIGAKNPALAGVWLQTGVFLSTLAAIPVAIALLLSESVYIAFGFGAEESRLAGQFASWIATGILPAFWYLVVSSFLKAQSDVAAAMIICLAMVLLNAFLNILFIHGTTWFQPEGADPLWVGLGFDGSPLATAASRWLSLFALVAYAWLRRAHQASQERKARDDATRIAATTQRLEGAAIHGAPRAAAKDKDCIDDTTSPSRSPTPTTRSYAAGSNRYCCCCCCCCTKGETPPAAFAKGSEAADPLLTEIPSKSSAPGATGATPASPSREPRRIRLTSTCAGLDCREALSWKRLWQLGCAFALPLALSNMLEELQLQVVAFMAAELGQAELAAHTCMLTLFFFCSSAMYSAVQATSTRVAHHLGAGNIPKAKLVMWIDVQFSIAAAVGVATMLAAAGENLARIFSTDPAVLDAVGSLSVLVGCAYAFICIFFCSMAVLNAMGKTSAVAIAFVTGAWMVAIPSAFVFDRVLHMGLNGLWYGLVAGYTVVSFIALWFLVRADWDEAARKAVKRAVRRQAASHSSQHSSSSRRRRAQLAPANRSPPRGPTSPLHVVHEAEDHPLPGSVGGGSTLSLNDPGV